MWGVLKSFAGVALSALFASTAQASAWNPEAWHGEIISAQVFLSADSASNEFDQTFRLDQYSKTVTQTFAKLGLTDRLALIGTFDWQDATIVGPGVNVSFSDPSTVSFGLQYQLRRKEGHAVALSASYFAGIDLPPKLLTIENREPVVELRGLWGESRTWGGINLFAEAQMAGRLDLDGGYAGAFSQLTVGADPLDRVKLIGKVRYTDVAGGVFENFPLARQERVEVEGSVVYRLRGRNYVEIGYVSLVTGRNTVSESGLKLGVWTKF
ncbi:hypothetical protein GCM10007854_10570 [Algimonas porphyrae]|uniref:Uncharacterized protein n=1 Tax=Algimonas porphyrae TaxID=1128113 RepID=A0ABQ5UZF2_9PROT|nr:hypothetical protein GCM10007854_10570 [Algimonas porphyrae]